MRVLIVDDSVVMRKIVESALRHADLNLTGVLQASNGAQGLAAIENAAALGHPVDLVLCDLHMPVLDGLGFLRVLSSRSLPKQLPVVMITADAADPSLHRAISAGASGYIAKPFTLQQVQTTLSSLHFAGLPDLHPTHAPLSCSESEDRQPIGGLP